MLGHDHLHALLNNCPLQLHFGRGSATMEWDIGETMRRKQQLVMIYLSSPFHWANAYVISLETLVDFAPVIILQVPNPGADLQPGAGLLVPHGACGESPDGQGIRGSTDEKGQVPWINCFRGSTCWDLDIHWSWSDRTATLTREAYQAL